MKLEETLNGGYAGLYGEVVDKDIYRLRDVEDIVSINDPKYVHEYGHKGIGFIPNVVFDFGANIGIFSRYARSLWPNALIIAVEPHPLNCEIFQEFTSDPNIILFQQAIGKGPLKHFDGAVNGSGEAYISSGIGFDIQKGNSDIKTVMPEELINQYVRPGQRFIVKMDIEGGEGAVFAHEPSMKALFQADYLCAEIHFYSLDKATEVRVETLEALKSFENTHHCNLDHVTFYATKK